MRLDKITGLLMLSALCGWANTVTVPNFSFENPGLTGAFQYRPAAADWTFHGSAGIAAVGSGFNLATAPDGSQVAFIQRQTGSMDQTLTGLIIGQVYVVSFESAERPDTFMPGMFFGGGQDFDVQWDGNSVGTFTPNSTDFSAYSTSFTATSTTGVLSFLGLDTQGGDRTAFIDAVSVAGPDSPVPEPGSAATLLGGLGLLGMGLFRTRFAAAHNR